MLLGKEFLPDLPPLTPGEKSIINEIQARRFHARELMQVILPRQLGAFGFIKTETTKPVVYDHPDELGSQVSAWLDRGWDGRPNSIGLKTATKKSDEEWPRKLRGKAQVVAIDGLEYAIVPGLKLPNRGEEETTSFRGNELERINEGLGRALGTIALCIDDSNLQISSIAWRVAEEQLLS